MSEWTTYGSHKWSPGWNQNTADMGRTHSLLRNQAIVTRHYIMDGGLARRAPGDGPSSLVSLDPLACADNRMCVKIPRGIPR